MRSSSARRWDASTTHLGRSLAYDLARRYESSGGCAGLPVIRLGSCLRVPRRALAELVATGRAFGSSTADC